MKTQFLELGEGSKMSLVKTNSLFAFDAIECERSTAFDVPATPANNRAFAFANNEHNDGEGMRKRYACQMQDGVVTKEGYIYVDSYSAGNYSAVFVGGDLLKLKQLKEAGSIRELYEGEEFVEYPAPIVYAANELNLPPFAYVDYFRIFGNVKPSWNLSHVLTNVLDKLGIGCQFSDDAKVLRIIPAEIQAVIKSEPLTLTRELTGNDYGYKKQDVLNDWTIDNGNNKGFYLNADTLQLSYKEVGTIRQVHTGNMTLLTAPYGDIKITFPDDFPADVFCCSLDGSTTYVDEASGDDSKVYTKFYGDYSIRGAIRATPPASPLVVEGEPLSGRIITIKAGEPFTFLRKSEFAVYNYTTPDWVVRPLIDTLNTTPLSFTLNIAYMQDNDNAAYENINLIDNITDIDIVDALKAVAAIEGKVLRYENETIYFDDLNFSQWQTFNIDKYALSYTDLRRTFADYGQNNIIRFDSSDNVARSEITNYTIENANLQETNELQVIPFSEGDFFAETTLFLDNNEEKEANKDSIAYTAKYGGSRLNKMGRVNAKINNGIYDLCEKSTSAKLSARLSLFDFEKITEKTIIQFNGALYVWTAAQWADEVAIFEISKI